MARILARRGVAPNKSGKDKKIQSTMTRIISLARRLLPRSTAFCGVPNNNAQPAISLLSYHCISKRTTALMTPSCNQVRFHRTDYEGPGSFEERETAQQHDHTHAHDHHTEDEKQQIRQLLQARYKRRSGTYSHRGYTIGIGGPGKIYYMHCCKSSYVVAIV